MKFGGYGDSLVLDANEIGCTRKGKDGDMVRSARIEERRMTSFGDDKIKIGLGWGE